METAEDALCRGLSRLSELLRKYGHHSQRQVVDEILATLRTSSPDHKRLTGVEMWGGAGAVWEVCLTPNWNADSAQREDERSFLRTIIRVAEAMECLKIANERSRSTAKIFQEWLDKGTV
jgi:hypothetical protein